MYDQTARGYVHGAFEPRPRLHRNDTFCKL